MRKETVVLIWFGVLVALGGVVLLAVFGYHLAGGATDEELRFTLERDPVHVQAEVYSIDRFATPEDAVSAGMAGQEWDVWVTFDAEQADGTVEPGPWRLRMVRDDPGFQVGDTVSVVHARGNASNAIDAEVFDEAIATPAPTS